MEYMDSKIQQHYDAAHDAQKDEMMDIWELSIGDTAIFPSGEKYRVVKDIRQHRPVLGVVPVRITKNIKTGKEAHFIYSFDVRKK